MNRRKLLAMSGAGMAIASSGCIDRVEEELNGDNFANEIEETQAEYESRAEELAFDEKGLGNCSPEQGTPGVISGGMCSESSTPLTRIESSENFGNISIYGFVFPSAEATDQLNEEVLSDRDADFIDKTDFDTYSLLLFQASFPNVANLSVDFVGKLPEERTYIGIESSMRHGEAQTFEGRWLRVDHSPLPETIIVGQTLTMEDGDQTSHAIYTNDS